MADNKLPYLTSEEIEGLVVRMAHVAVVVRRQQEELITSIVPVPEEWVKEEKEKFLVGKDLKEVLKYRGWNEEDLDLHLSRPEALRLFSEARWGPSLEESFLASKGAYDEVVYSILRVEDMFLARELWIRLEEGEAAFVDLATNYGEGPEASRKGIVGPIAMGQIRPLSLGQCLRSLQNGEIHPPIKMSDGTKEWHALIRLENLTPARFDVSMRSDLLKNLLNKFLDDRVKKIMKGDSIEEIHYEQG